MSSVKFNILKDTFENKFDVLKFRKFTREFFNEPEMLKDIRHTGIWKEYTEHVKAYYNVAKYTDSEDNNLIVMAVELEKNTSISRARSMQRNFISKILDENSMEAAIVAFYTEDEPSWRLSFVRLDYSLTEKGIDLELTPSRRYSYLVGENEPNHTAQEQLLPLFENDNHNPTLKEIEDAFSVEKVTKEFFNQYKEKYLNIKEYLEKDESFITETKKLGFEIEKFSEQFSKKLMGQLAFLYFLQKKGWLGVRIMPASHLISNDSFKKIYDNQDNIHKSILEKIFKNTKDGNMKLSSKSLLLIDEHEAELLSDCFINTEYDMPWGSGNRRFIREIFDFCKENTNKNFFDDYLEPFFYDALNKKRKNQYFKEFNCKIPFLNGGLFEPLEGYHWRDVNFEIPNELFSNKEEKGRDADGILDIFDRFNFTINEDEPLEKEIAVDPEMLGKIFENLLDVRDRKSKGAFYTPREIVHYMCQESLINYLVNEVYVPYDDIKKFILYGEIIRDKDNGKNVGFGEKFIIEKSVLDNIHIIDEALKNVRVADPAVGSGAFSLGMLNEIVRARNNITEYLVKKDKTKEGIDGRGIQYGEERIRYKRSLYELKWKTIKNSIFAVDIEPSAVDITKLRLWLSVVVDQEIDEKNPEPHPLPNLDMNIHVGNSLIDEYEGIKLFDESILKKEINKTKENDGFYFMENPIQINWLLDHSDEMLKEMFEFQDRYFEEENEQRKKEFKQKIDKIRNQLINYKLTKDSNDKALLSYEKSLINKAKPYFIWELEFAKVFKEKGGFDIVIGNPPYIGFHNVPNKDYFKERYFSATGKYDFYVLFIEKGINLLKSKGYISFICPSYFYKRNYGKNIRKLILEKTKIKLIVDFKDSQIFDSATTYTCIFGFEIDSENSIQKIRINSKDLNTDKFYEINQNSLKEPVWLLEDMSNMELLQKIKLKSNYTFGDITKSISQGIVTGNNSIYILDEDILVLKNINMNYLEPVYKGKDIRNNKLCYNKQYVFYPYELDAEDKNVLVDEVEIQQKNPNLYEHLLKNKEELLKREYFVKSNKKWYELWNPRKKKHFINRKFVFSEINDKNDFVLCDKCFYSDSACGAELKDQFLAYEEYIQKYLNCELITNLYKKISVPKANGYLIYKNAFLKNLPIYLPENINKSKEILKLSNEDFNKWLCFELNIK